MDSFNAIAMVPFLLVRAILFGISKEVTDATSRDMVLTHHV